MLKIIKRCALVLICLTFIKPSYASECKGWKPEYFAKNDLVVDKIEINNNNIFDVSSKKESNLVYRTANKLHIKTTADTIRQQLLFKTGDTFLPQKLEETERNLRSRKYIKDARVSPSHLCGQKVTVKVMTRDNWTFSTGLSAGRSGGNNTIGFEVQEQNIFGRGKDIKLRYTTDSERDTTTLSYRDYHLLGSHNKLLLDLLNNSDGKGYKVDLGLPFYATDSRRSWGIKSSELRQVVPVYDKGEVIDKVTEDEKFHSLFYGWSTSDSEKTTNRIKVGWSVKKSHFIKPLNTLDDLKITETYPWIEFTNLKVRYVKKRNFNTMGKIEDISLTRQYSIGAGFLLEEFGSSDNQLKLTSTFSKGSQLNKSLLGFVEIKTDNYLGQGIREGGTHSIKGELNHFNHSGNDIRLSSTFRLSDNLIPSKHIYLGGDTGLRGYPKAYQAGNKSLIFQAEKRLHFDWYPLQIAKFGAVAFSDIGTSWGEENDPKLLANIGVGLRMIPTRASSAKTLHLNLAAPLTERGDIDKIQLSIRTADSF